MELLVRTRYGVQRLFDLEAEGSPDERVREIETHEEGDKQRQLSESHRGNRVHRRCHEAGRPSG
jgi:hypothetical protein